MCIKSNNVSFGGGIVEYLLFMVMYSQESGSYFLITSSNILWEKKLTVYYGCTNDHLIIKRLYQ